MSIKHVIIEGFGFAPIGFVVTEGFGALTEGTTTRRVRGDAWAPPRKGQPKRYLDRVEIEEREELLRALEKATEEVIDEPVRPRTVTKKQKKEIARIVLDDIAPYVAQPLVFSADFAELTSSIGNLEKLVTEYFEAERLRIERAIAEEAQRIDDEAAMMLLSMVI